MGKILITVLLVGMLVILASFAFFTAFRYCGEDKPEKIFFICIGTFTLIVSIIVAIGINS